MQCTATNSGEHLRAVSLKHVGQKGQSSMNLLVGNFTSSSVPVCRCVIVNMNCVLFVLSEFRLALIQLAVTANKADNVRRATELIANASKQGAQLISLPVSKRVSLMFTVGCMLTSVSIWGVWHCLWLPVVY